MYKFNYNLIYFFFIKKFLKSGKTKTAFVSLNNFLSLTKNRNVFHKSLLSLFIPLYFKKKRTGILKCNTIFLSHYYKSILLPIKWIVDSIKRKKFSKRISFYKTMYAECSNVFKKKGIAYRQKRKFLVKNLQFARNNKRNDKRDF